MASEFSELDAHRVGISADSVSRQKEFDTTNTLGYPLLSDGNKAIAKQMGVKRMGPIPSKRATFVIGTDFKVLAAVSSETSMTDHADKALEALRAAA